MYYLVIVAFSILGDLSIIAMPDFETKKQCEELAPRAVAVMLRDKVGMTPTQVRAACVTELEFEKFTQAVGERSKQMEQDGVEAQKART